MRNLLKLVAASLTAFVLLPSHSFAINNVNAAAISICEPTGTMLASGGNCRSTPTQYGITIYEMGLCTSHPFGAAKTAAAFDTSVCVQTLTSLQSLISAIYNQQQESSSSSQLANQSNYCCYSKEESKPKDSRHSTTVGSLNVRTIQPY